MNINDLARKVGEAEKKIRQLDAEERRSTERLVSALTTFEQSQSRKQSAVTKLAANVRELEEENAHLREMVVSLLHVTDKLSNRQDATDIHDLVDRLSQIVEDPDKEALPGLARQGAEAPVEPALMERDTQDTPPVHSAARQVREVIETITGAPDEGGLRRDEHAEPEDNEPISLLREHPEPGEQKRTASRMVLPPEAEDEENEEDMVDALISRNTSQASWETGPPAVRDIIERLTQLRDDDEQSATG